MCGICGLATADANAPVPESILAKMRRSLAHRGPDGSGVEIADGVGLVHTRLSIIDVGGGRQPLSNEDGSVWVTFNGEIYNYEELRSTLVQRGHRFRTQSDTEILVHLYEDHGDALVQHLNGMFAFAIHDRRRRRVLLARDHFGIKPLFYGIRGETLAFGSEIKAVVAGLGTAAETTPEAIQEYLLFRTMGAERSFFSGVNRLPPGSIGVWEGGALAVHRYWEAPAPHPESAMTMPEAVDALEEHLEAAVRLQLMSEVPLGTFCSGGVDSGLTSLYAARHTTQRLQTFSAGFGDAAWDETELALSTATRIGSDHRVLQADPAKFLHAMPRLVWHHDEPLGHPNSILIALLSEFARRHVTVVLTGEGSDELFGGYPRHHIVGLVAHAQHYPNLLRKSAGAFAGRFGGRKGSMIRSSLDLSVARAIVMNTALLSTSLVERLTGTSVTAAIQLREAEAERLMIADDPIASITRYDQRFYLPALLDRMDRMTMAHGLEGRVPFLDVRLAEWAARVPSRFKLGRLQNKRVVKLLAQRYLDPRITAGPKSGFGVPYGAWFRSEAWGPMIERLLDRNHPATSVIDPVVVRALVSEHMSATKNHDDVLWLLSNLYLWHETRFEA